MFEHLLIGSCMELLGMTQAIDTYSLPIICDPTPVEQCGSTSVWGPPMQVSETECLINVRPDDEWFDFTWCQPVIVNGVEVTTPCKSEVVLRADTPYSYRVFMEAWECPEWAWGWMCEPQNVCTPADELAELCTVDP